MLIVTNTKRFPLNWRSSCGEQGISVIASTPSEFLRYKDEKNVVFVVDCNPGLGYRLAAALWMRRSPALVSVDFVLRRSSGVKSRLLLPLRRLLLRRFQHHIHYFRDTSKFGEVYAIAADRFSHVPFKANLHFEPQPPADGSGEYILCFGRSLRDFDTFFDAVETLPYPAAIPEPNFKALNANGARFTRKLSALPRNVRLLPDTYTQDATKQILLAAKIVVLTTLRSNLVCAGIGTCLNAMAAGKCVIGTQGPGMSDLFQDEALIVPPDDPKALAAMIRRAWEDDDLRRRTALAGQKYAISQGGEPELYQRIIDDICSWQRRSGVE